MTIQELATECQGYLTRKERVEGNSESTIVLQKDDAPEWFTDLCRTAHGDMLPDDHRYEFIEEAIDAIADCDSTDEIDMEADIYTHYLLKWLSSRTDRYSYVDNAIENFGYPGDLIRAIAMGQVEEKTEVLYAVISSLETRLEELEEIAQ